MHALIEFPIKGELYSAERLEEYAAYLAAHLEISEDPKLTQPLLPRMRENGKNLLSSYRALSEAIHRKETLPAAAEWLTDNFHIVEEQLREIAEDLPPSYYKELPKIAIGELAGYPRIYAIALALIAHTDSQLEPEIIRRFICAFQKVSALSIGELWALAITLRLVLVENLNRISSHILSDHDKRNLANKFADELIAASSNQKKFETVLLKLPSLNCKSLDSDCAYIAQIAKRLRDQEPEIWPALEFLEKQLLLENSSPEKIVHALHHRQAANQVSVANIITSMRLLSSLNWRIFFESVSLVDRILEVDPVYGQMDFATRDRYRHVIETLGNKSGVTETAIAARVSDLASAATIDSPSEIRKSHVGYYLIGEGATQLETHYGCRIKPKFSSFLLSKPNLVYFGLLIIFMTLLCGIPFFYLAFNNASVWALLAVECLLIIPCSDLALSLTNLVLTHSIRPFHLPKLDYSSGIPNGAETIVVIPCMLSNTGVIDGLLEKIEIHYLGNADPNLFFALLSDFEDASSATVPQDEAYLARAVAGISRLNRKYVPNSPDRFHIFHRARQWNASESRWIGWERKRGKIQEFNSLLRGIKKTSFTTATAPLDFLNTIQFVITLDSDSQLPRDAAKKWSAQLCIR